MQIVVLLTHDYENNEIYTDLFYNKEDAVSRVIEEVKSSGLYEDDKNIYNSIKSQLEHVGWWGRSDGMVYSLSNEIVNGTSKD